MREGAALTLDLLPDLTLEQVTERLARPRGKLSISSYLRKTLRLDGARMALVNEFARPLPQGPALAQTLKALEVHHAGPRPIDEAISTAGGVTQAAVNGGLMLTARPGVFCAGEMLDWEAPTGGYLLTAGFATGLWAGRHAAEWAA
jgi:predicted flavoprotein YhiN